MHACRVLGFGRAGACVLAMLSLAGGAKCGSVFCAVDPGLPETGWVAISLVGEQDSRLWIDDLCSNPNEV